jgi:1,3-beta-glucanosyltransferase GAS5
MPPLTIQSNRFIVNGEPFLFRGVVYQLASRRWRSNVKPAGLPPRERYADRDPLSDMRIEDLKRDLALFKELGINALWVYIVCIEACHDEVMQLLKDSGIYVFIGCSAPSAGECVSRMSPEESYNASLLQRFYGVVDAFSKYDNVAGFVLSHHLLNSPEHTRAAEVLKAVVRDVKAYIAVHASPGRQIVPVGLEEESWAAMKTPSLEYYTAGRPSERVDFYAFVDFSGGQDVKLEKTGSSGLSEPERFASSSVPVFISEFGNNLHRPRQFQEARLLYDDSRSKVFSGGFAYEFFEGPNRYGLVRDTEEGISKMEDFECLRLAWEQTTNNDNSLQHRSGAHESTHDLPYPATSETWRASADIPRRCPLSAEDYLRQRRDVGEEHSAVT